MRWKEQCLYNQNVKLLGLLTQIDFETLVQGQRILLKVLLLKVLNLCLFFFMDQYKLKKKIVYFLSKHAKLYHSPVTDST